VDFLSLLRVEHVGAHSREITISHDVEAVSLVVGIPTWESMGLPSSATAEHELVVRVLENRQTISVFRILNPECMPIVGCLFKFTSSISFFDFMSYITSFMLDNNCSVSDVEKEFFTILVLLGFHIKH
jgi:hypothetical protein